MRERKRRGITRREFLGVGIATGISAFFGGLLAGRSMRSEPRTVQEPYPGSARITAATELKAIEPVERAAETGHAATVRASRQFRVFRPGLKGEEFARAYGVPFTRGVFDLKNVPAELLHDVKMLVAEECRKYNSALGFNPGGVQLVDPYEVLAVIEHESHYNPNAVGKAGDAGLGQLMPSQIRTLANLRELPVKITDPYDPVQNISGVVRTFVWLKQHPPNMEYQTPFRRWAAYNRGRGKARSLSDSGGNSYANRILAIWNRMKAENTLQNYI